MVEFGNFLSQKAPQNRSFTMIVGESTKVGTVLSTWDAEIELCSALH